MKYDIFISYRREDGYDTAKHLNDLLVRDGYKVSFDIDTLRNGDFDIQLLERIEQCKDFILIVDKHAFDRTLDPTFPKHKDWLRCELAHALKHKKNIIPVFLSGVSEFPEGLPDEIAGVVTKNGPEFNKYYFDDFYRTLRTRFIRSKSRSNRIFFIVGLTLPLVLLLFLIIGKILLPETKDKTFNIDGVSFKMVYVQGGMFQMGTNDCWIEEKPVHTVTLSDYYIGETEVTQELWYAVMGSNPSSRGASEYPVETVSWDDCQNFIYKLNELLHDDLDGMKFRLPSEAQWEFAARGGNKSMNYVYSGSNDINCVAWYKSNSGGTTHPVAELRPNELGIYDMSGNVHEWCSDGWSEYRETTQLDPEFSPVDSLRVRRGGCWDGLPIGCQVAKRHSYNFMGKYDFIGLRLSLTANAE